MIITWLISTSHIQCKLIAREIVIFPRKMVAAVDVGSLLWIFLVQKLLRYFPELFQNLFLQVALYIAVHKNQFLSGWVGIFIWRKPYIYFRELTFYHIYSSSRWKYPVPKHSKCKETVPGRRVITLSYLIFHKNTSIVRFFRVEIRYRNHKEIFPLKPPFQIKFWVTN